MSKIQLVPKWNKFDKRESAAHEFFEHGVSI